MTDVELAKLVLQSPVHRDEHTWLLVNDYLLRRLRELVPGEVQFGSYWISNYRDKDGSFGCRIRSQTGLPFVPESDAWEASFGTSGDDRSTWSGIDAFPFRRGRVVRPAGMYWYLSFFGDSWVSRGWRRSDGPGEWEWVKRTGDCYTFRLACEVVRRPLLSRPPIVVIRPYDRHGDRWRENAIRVMRVSLHHVRRRGERDDLSGETLLALCEPSRAVTVSVSFSPRTISGEFALEHLPIRGGWIPGVYEVALRTWPDPHRLEGPESFVTEPITFAIR